MNFVNRKRKLSEVKNKEPQEERPVEKPGAPDGDDDEFSDIMSQYLLQADQGNLVFNDTGYKQTYFKNDENETKFMFP